MKNKIDYIDNAKIIDLSNLPRIGAEHEHIKSIVCIELKIIDFKKDDLYIIYQARFCEKESLHILDDFYINCCTYQYAVKNKEREKHYFNY